MGLCGLSWILDGFFAGIYVFNMGRDREYAGIQRLLTSAIVTLFGLGFLGETFTAIGDGQPFLALALLCVSVFLFSIAFGGIIRALVVMGVIRWK